MSRLRICLAASEMAPFAKTGGLGDVCGSLVTYLTKHGHDVRAFLPLYGRIDASGFLPVDFVRDVRPIFEEHCYKCHGGEKQKNGFRLDVKHGAFHSGDEHAPNIVAGRSAESPLFRFVSGADEKVRMPPEEKGGPLSPAART